VIPLWLTLLGAFDPWAAPPSVSPEWLGGQRRVEAPRRIVSLVPSATEILLALGAGAKVVAVSRYDDAPELRSLPKVGGFLDPSVEAVVAARPDLVIGVKNPGNRAALERIGRHAPTLLIPGASLSDFGHGVRAIAAALGPDAAPRARALLAEIGDRIRTIESRAERLPSRRYAFVYGHDPLVLAGPGSFADSLLSALHATNVVKVEAAYPTYSLERLLVDAPEVIIDATPAHGEGGSSYWQRWPNLPAVKNGRVHEIQGSELMRPGTRIAEAMEQLAKMLE
jgi:iron complex transport system substrate-binding protein